MNEELKFRINQALQEKFPDASIAITSERDEIIVSVSVKGAGWKIKSNLTNPDKPADVARFFVGYFNRLFQKL